MTKQNDGSLSITLRDVVKNPVIGLLVVASATGGGSLTTLFNSNAVTRDDFHRLEAKVDGVAAQVNRLEGRFERDASVTQIR